jgi:hypothetical protein
MADEGEAARAELRDALIDMVETIIEKYSAHDVRIFALEHVIGAAGWLLATEAGLEHAVSFLEQGAETLKEELAKVAQ